MDSNTSSYNASFPPDPYTVSPIKEIIIATFLTIFPVSLFGNLLVIYVIVRNRKLRTVTNFFLGNLAFADLLVSIFCLIPKMLFFVMVSWPLGSVVCALHNYVMSVVTKASIFTLTLISFERYFAIIHPFRVRHLLTIKKLAVATFLLWIASLFLSAPIYFMSQVREYSGDFFCTVNNDITMTWKIIHDGTMMVVCFILPLILMLVFYSKIIRKLWCGLNVLSINTWITQPAGSKPQTRLRTRFSFQTEITYQDGPTNCANYETSMIRSGNPGNVAKNGTQGENSKLLGSRGFLHPGEIAMSNLNRTSVTSADERTTPVLGSTTHFERQRKSNMYQRNHTRKKVVRMLIAIVISFVICMLPLQIYFVWDFIGTYPFEETWALLFFPAAYAMYFLNSCLNPIIYAILSSNFRSKMKETLTCRVTRVTANVHSPEHTRKRSLSESPVSV